LHAAFQVAWALAMLAPLATAVSEFTRHQTTSGALEIIEVSAIWALVALLGWSLRVAALTTSGRWGATTRERVRRAGRRRGGTGSR
jgi:hypothetical protein